MTGEADMLDAIGRCWASFWSARADAYRRCLGSKVGECGMAVLVQEMIPCEAAGVAFTTDPLSCKDAVVIEAAPGRGDAVVDGLVHVERYTVDRASRKITADCDRRHLSDTQVRRLAEAALALEDLFRQPQDVEWGFAGDLMYILQSRPITALAPSPFTDILPSDKHLWTSAFLNERFSSPMSPLGWALIRELLDRLAFRDPLRYLGYPGAEKLPVTKLHQGHPFVNVRVFQVLYKLFPDRLLPEDARRFFPRGDTAMRREADYPSSLFAPRLLWSLLRHFLADAANWSPFHNHRCWKNFLRLHETSMDSLVHRCEKLDSSSGLDQALLILEDAQALSARLLAIHRWSLTHADVFYSLLRRLSVSWLNRPDSAAVSARLVSGLPNKSMELNRALQQLAAGAALHQFMEAYGHRSFSLDIFHPTFAEEPDRVLQMAGRQLRGPDSAISAAGRESELQAVRRSLRPQSLGQFKVRLFDWILGCARHYMPLREDQRFYWQQALALQRRVCLWMGRRCVERGDLERADAIFHFTLDEVRRMVRGKVPASDAIARRRSEFARLQAMWENDPELAYPAFLLGREPLRDQAGEDLLVLRGVAVSPGLASGPARLIVSPADFERIAPGDILVTRAADPGWTPIFGRLAGLVTETGGQLSHGAVIAREYGLPAVSGVEGASRLLQKGDRLRCPRSFQYGETRSKTQMFSVSLRASLSFSV